MAAGPGSQPDSSADSAAASAVETAIDLLISLFDQVQPCHAECQLPMLTPYNAAAAAACEGTVSRVHNIWQSAGLQLKCAAGSGQRRQLHSAQCGLHLRADVFCKCHAGPRCRGRLRAD